MATRDERDTPELKPRQIARPIPNSYIVPGYRLVAGEYPGAPTPEQSRARLTRFLDAGITSFIDLTAPLDPLAPYVELLREMAPHVEYTRLSVADMGIPRVPRMRKILEAIEAALAADRTVYLHCWGGVGRTGTVVGCWLVRHGMPPEQALVEVARLFSTMSPDKLRGHPEGSPQTDQQRNFIRRWSETLPPQR